MRGYEEERRVHFTLKDALKLGYEHIIRRLDRATINIASIALGIAFLTTLLMTDTLYRAHALAGGARMSVETYQYWLMFVALVVSVVGITNAMLIAVYERYREIGTMKCLGAMDRHILLLFLVESFIQGVVGGVTGFVVGILGALLSTGFTIGFDVILKVPPTELLGLLAGSTLLSTILSVGATTYPAFRAAKLNPVEALSYEL
ncbi:FtsX-like permease family protein [Candidatus Bathyarchaeota archaeon]|nr:MAG: FtsX-like permease family protein [Candidatus Bathyarchaeota archaeon]